jgi:hypothetical protein
LIIAKSLARSLAAVDVNLGLLGENMEINVARNLNLFVRNL